jgi:D-alanyl-D-alanine carboxypeptidase/D-alanyl-D-alanine-endopeptidase (penicillin-binding protein 4)
MTHVSLDGLTAGMGRAFAIAIVAITIAMPAFAVVPRSVTRAFLDARVPMNAVGIVVQEARAARPLFAHQADRPFNPASVM